MKRKRFNKFGVGGLPEPTAVKVSGLIRIFLAGTFRERTRQLLARYPNPLASFRAINLKFCQRTC